MKKLVRLFVIGVMMAFVGNVHSSDANLVQKVAGNNGLSHEYQIGPGDVLIISVWKEEDLQQQVLVRPDGGISFPLVGDLKASGLSVSELTERLESRLKKFIPDPVISVSVAQTVSQKIYVVGKVARPGVYNATHYMDVLQLLSLAGGVTVFAESDEIKIIRKTGDKKEVFIFDYEDALDGVNLDSNIELKAGDTILVP